MRLSLLKKDQSITYLVFDAEDASLVGFPFHIEPICLKLSHFG